MVNDINIFDYTVLLLALIAAETAMALSLIIGSRGLSGRLSVRNNVSNPNLMAAPTPVSALLHAATIMVSGIFFILRLTTVVH